ncbi:hypothetical protein CTI12_AA620000 [Artemisia annua]|uniref:Uncharacterized protein n=1 Tax=Artemisia annua TaxID=35608 RepID=A0A2U1KC64_ARTAN|nr:hypothetical protein CTI12_AA620000 [Artemisia annua]
MVTDTKVALTRAGQHWCRRKSVLYGYWWVAAKDAAVAAAQERLKYRKSVEY